MRESLFPSGPERRIHQRIDAALEVEIVADGKKIPATTENISCGGMYIATHKPFIDESAIKLAFKLPNEQKKIQMNAEVVRTSNNEKTPSGVAIRFNQHLDNENLLAISRFIKNKLH